VGGGGGCETSRNPEIWQVERVMPRKKENEVTQKMTQRLQISAQRRAASIITAGDHLTAEGCRVELFKRRGGAQREGH